MKDEIRITFEENSDELLISFSKPRGDNEQWAAASPNIVMYEVSEQVQGVVIAYQVDDKLAVKKTPDENWSEIISRIKQYIVEDAYYGFVIDFQ